jgi:hypothetical protein
MEDKYALITTLVADAGVRPGSSPRIRLTDRRLFARGPAVNRIRRLHRQHRSALQLEIGVILLMFGVGLKI